MPTYRKTGNFFVPVVNQKDKPLMPTTLLRARRWINSDKATPFYKKGIFCVRLNVKPSDSKKEKIVIGIDPGSKREAFTVKSKAHTYLNILTETPYWVSKAVEVRRNMRRARRFRKCRRRPARFNNRRGTFLAPSTRARWQWKLRILDLLNSIFPITDIVVEDIAAKMLKNKRKWNASFSPLQVGKQWFYKRVKTFGKLQIKQGYETKELREQLGLKKSSSKLSDKFECHNVDSWVLANSLTGGHNKPDNKQLIKFVPLRFHRRQLHVFQFLKGGIRRNYGSTRSLGSKRGSLIRHRKYGLCYVGGNMDNRISLHCVKTGKRLCQNARREDCKFLSYSSVRKSI